MNRICQRLPQLILYGCICCLGIMVLSGCAMYHFPDSSIPGGQGAGSPPTLSNMSVSPNPAHAGSIVNLTAAYVDPDADLQYGVAAVSVNGGDLSRIAFRATYVSGILTIPLPVSYYSRPSDVQVSLRIRDSAGNWSNMVSTMLAIR